LLLFFVGMASQKNKQELAYDLYINTNKTQKEICEIVGCVEKTFRQWKTKGGWDEMRGAHLMTREKTVKMLLQQINKIEQAARQEERAMTSAETDQIHKFSKTVQQLDKSVKLSHYIEVFEQFQGWLVNYDAELAKQVIAYMDEYINIKSNELQ